MKAEDLRQEVKAQLLEHIQKTLGDAEYSRLVSDMGEDGIVNQFMKQIEQSATPPKKEQNPLFFYVPITILMVACIVVWILTWKYPALDRIVKDSSQVVFGIIAASWMSIYAYHMLSEAVPLMPGIKPEVSCERCGRFEAYNYKTVEKPHRYFKNYHKCMKCKHKWTTEGWAINVTMNKTKPVPRP